MKPTTLTLLLLFLLGVSVQARIGETLEECVKRYGEPIQPIPRTANKTVFFHKAEISVTCTFRDSKCVQISYKKLNDKARFFHSREIDILKAANGSQWQLQARSSNEYPYWRNDVCEMMYDGHTGLLQIETLEEQHRQRKEKADAERKLLEGF